MKKNKLLISIGSVAGVFAASMPLSTLSSCSCSCTKTTPSFEVSKDENIELVTCSSIEKGKDLSIVITLKEGYQIDTLVIKIGDKQLTAETDYTITDNIVTVKASAMTSVQVKVEVKSKLEEAPTVTLKYDAMKNYSVYTYNVIPVNYPFEISDVYSFFGLQVSVDNFKVDNVTKTVPTNLITWRLSSDGDIIVNFDITILFSTFSFTADAVATFDLTFINSLTGLNTTIPGFTLNIEYATKPAQGTTVPWINSIYDFEYANNYHTGVPENELVRFTTQLFLYDYPHFFEEYGCTDINISDMKKIKDLSEQEGGYVGKDLEVGFISFYDSMYTERCDDIPECIENISITNTDSKNIILYFAYEDGDDTGTTEIKHGFKTIDLGKDISSATSSIYINGRGYHTAVSSNEYAYLPDPAFKDNTNLTKIIFSSKRKTVIQSTWYKETWTGTVTEKLTDKNTPFYGCKNLSTFDMSDFTTLEDVSKVEFILGKTTDESRDIKIFNSAYNTTSTNGSIIVPKGASDAIKDAWKTKFETAGLTIDGTNWKIVEAE